MDLVALGMDADMMSLKSLETKYLIREGLKLNNLHNPFISAIAEKNDFSLKGSSRGFLTPMGAAFYIAPFVNAIVRSGTEDEKEQVETQVTGTKTKEQLLATLSENMKLNKPSGLTLEQFKKVLANNENDKNKIFEENAEYFYYIEKQYNVNGIFVAAVGIHESGWGTSKI